MNLKTTLERLPESILPIIMAEPSVSERMGGEKSLEFLEQVLRSTEWAKAWLRLADYEQVEVLKCILTQFAAIPFELETLANRLSAHPALTGAAVRVAIAKLRRSGVLFAVRKAWGDRLFFLPTDSVALWQPILLPVHAQALVGEQEREVTKNVTAFRLPLSLELFACWCTLKSNPIAITAKGTLNRPAIARLISKTRITVSDLNGLSLSYPHSEQLSVLAAFVLDLGLGCGVLYKTDKEIGINDPGLKTWLTLSPAEADRRLHELMAIRYASSNPAWHFASSIVHSLTADRWFHEDDIGQLYGEGDAGNVWLTLLEASGWIERGLYRGKAVFRKKGSEGAFAVQGDPYEQERYIVQPDGEIIVPPGTGMGARWILEEIADREVADRLFVYRLTREACRRAYDAGYSLRSVKALLESGSGEGLPNGIAGALEDWFEPLGKVELKPVLLLRTAKPEIAAYLNADAELSRLLLEQLGDRDFIIEATASKALYARLNQLGYPPSERENTVANTSEVIEVQQQSQEQGWIYRRHELSYYEADGRLPDLEELFPGMDDIPVKWVREPLPYHASTRKKLMQKAIDWQTSVQVGHDGCLHVFIPRALEDKEGKWHALGRWKSDDGRQTNRLIDTNTVSIPAEDINELMIVLPELAAFESFFTKDGFPPI